MRPEISDTVIDRLEKWASKQGYRNRRMGKRGHSYYTIEDAISDLLKEAGF